MLILTDYWTHKIFLLNVDKIFKTSFRFTLQACSCHQLRNSFVIFRLFTWFLSVYFSVLFQKNSSWLYVSQVKVFSGLLVASHGFTFQVICRCWVVSSLTDYVLDWYVKTLIKAPSIDLLGETDLFIKLGYLSKWICLQCQQCTKAGCWIIVQHVKEMYLRSAYSLI